MLTFEKARQGFRFSNQLRNLSPRTIGWYDSELSAFQEFILARYPTKESLYLQEIRREDIEAFVSSLQERDTLYPHHKFRSPVTRKLSAFTVNARVRALHSFFHWIIREKFLEVNPMEGIARPKTPKSFKPRFSEDEIKRLLKACDKSTESLAARNKSLVLLLLDTGVRASELTGLTLDRLDDQLRRIHVTGKGLKDRFCPLGARTRAALWTYIHVHRQPTETNAVFLSHLGKPLDPGKLAHILRGIGKKADVLPCNPHRFRHTAARLYLRNGGDVATLQLLLGHSDLSTTSIYSRMETEDLEQKHARCSPVDRLPL